MHAIFEALHARDGFDRKEAAILRTLIEKALMWCSDLLVYAPLLLGKQDTALTWKEATQREWPLQDAMALVEQAIPPVRDELILARTGDWEDFRTVICGVERAIRSGEFDDEWPRTRRQGHIAPSVYGSLSLDSAPTV